jgi:hypothetical protein
LGEILKSSSIKVISSLIQIDEETLESKSLVSIWNRQELLIPLSEEDEHNESHFSNSSFYSCKILVNYLKGVEEFLKSGYKQDEET